ncbi:unnamed protein product [Paramecium pentaurelia]|uniref:Uncharacterized protein n=1 Tax=Paramecium pentaurelia TaxID=43138 RepID=A0A8S1VGW0_9CILI|nr:unnamed protein product [Paramecium pentaurelia]
MKIKIQKASRSKYKSISSSERALIINYIEEYKYSTSHVSMITGHNASTIKAIYSVYKKQGRINKKAKRDKILNLTFGIILFVVDDIQGNLTKISMDSQESQHQIIEEGQFKLSTCHEQAIKKNLEQNKHKIISLLDNATSLDTFNREVNLITQQEYPSEQFSSLKLLSHSSRREQANFKMNNNFRSFFGLFSENQEDLAKDGDSKSIIVKKLHEQYELMKM